MIRYITILILICLMIRSQGFSQQVLSKDQLIEMAKSGMLDKLSPSEIRSKLKEMGISEDDAIQMAQAKGVDLGKYLGRSARPMQNQPTTPQTQSPNQVIDTSKVGIPGALSPLGQQSLQTQNPFPISALPPLIDTTKRIPPDTTKIPKGPFGLDYFGYQIFRKLPAAFEPNEVGPIDPNYIIGAGDELLLSVWGQTEFQYVLEVDKEGKVFIPNAGQIFVSGTALNHLQEKLKNQLSKYYAGMASNPPTVFLDVTITKLRPLRVFVMGELTQPGGYTISNYATVFNALYAVGGPTVKGSLRGVKVLRDNKLIATVDLYDYLLRGDQTSDIQLQNNDVIFIPPRGKTVSIRGEVRREAVYELKDNENVAELVKLAGGLLPTAYVERAQIERIKPFSERNGEVIDRVILDFNLSDVIKKSKESIILFDGDDILVNSILDDMKNFVTIDGPVWRPGRYELTTTPTLKSLIAAAEGLQPRVYTAVGHLIRENADLISKRIIPFNLGSILDGSTPDFTLQARDEIYLYSTEVIMIKDRYATIFGEVKKPGKYHLHDNMTLADLILMAGGYTQEANILTAEVSRVRPEGMKGDTASIILHPDLPREFSKVAAQRFTDSTRAITSSDFVLEHRDEVLIQPNPEYKEQQNVYILGDITYPGVYAIRRRGETLSEMLLRAGGPTRTSYFGGSEFTRDGKRFLVNFEEAFYKKNKQHDVLMFGGDSIMIPSSPHTVQVEGEVNNPGVLTFLDGRSTLDYIDRAGGLTDSANYVIVFKPTGETQRVNFGFLRSNPDVPEGSRIRVTKIPPPAPEGKGFDISGTIKDTFAILSSAATLAFLIYQVTK